MVFVTHLYWHAPAVHTPLQQLPFSPFGVQERPGPPQTATWPVIIPLRTIPVGLDGKLETTTRRQLLPEPGSVKGIDVGGLNPPTGPPPETGGPLCVRETTALLSAATLSQPHVPPGQSLEMEQVPPSFDPPVQKVSATSGPHWFQQSSYV